MTTKECFVTMICEEIEQKYPKLPIYYFFGPKELHINEIVCDISKEKGPIQLIEIEYCIWKECQELIFRDQKYPVIIVSTRGPEDSFYFRSDNERVQFYSDVRSFNLGLVIEDTSETDN